MRLIGDSKLAGSAERGLNKAMTHCRVFVALLLLSLATSCSTTRSGPASARESTPTRLRILSYNIHHAEGTDGKLDLERIARVIRDAQPDFVALQEVDDRATRSGGVNQTAELGRLTGMYASFGQAMVFQGGGYGQAVLSRWPPLWRTVHMLPQRARREPRIALVIGTHAGEHGRELAFASTHFDHEIEEIRVEQATQLHALMSTNSQPTILAGDFNANPESRPMRIFLTNWVDAAVSNPQPTIPSDRPTRRIDYILLRPREVWRIIETRVIEESVASDHRPVLTVVELLP